MPTQQVKFRGVKATPKALEKGLIETSKMLRDNPAIIIPQCSGEKCRKCRFDKVQRKIEKVSNYKDDPDKLNKMAMHGDQLVRAYAAAISLAASGKIPYLTAAQLPVGEVSFAVRGKVDREKLIGIQHFDDPDLRLLAYFDIAKKRDLHIYSTNERLFCSEAGADVPDKYVTEMLEQSEYKLKGLTCGHPESDACLIINWKSSGKEVRVCHECAKEVNLISWLSSRIAANQTNDDFEVNVERKLHCIASDCADCPSKKAFEMSDDLKRSYMDGKISDKELINRYIEELNVTTRWMESVYISGADCYGHDKNKFLADVKGNESEMMALNHLLEVKNVSIVSSSNQAGKIITDIWEPNRQTLLEAVASQGVIEDLLKRTDLTPPQMVQEARRMEQNLNISSALPRYSKLGEIGAYADLLARTFKTEGKDAMVRATEKGRQKDHRIKSISFAFLNSAGDTSKNWQFNKEETDYGIYLAQFAQKMLESTGSQYDEALRNLLAASGASEPAVLEKN
ncbi:MAG TPA: hypothetical protein VGK23_10440 [Methanomassiliicoccales archaeon]|jgi:hypothetical protein